MGSCGLANLPGVVLLIFTLLYKFGSFGIWERYGGMAEQVALCAMNRAYKPPTIFVLGQIPPAQARRSEVWRNEALRTAQARCGTWEMFLT